MTSINNNLSAVVVMSFDALPQEIRQFLADRERVSRKIFNIQEQKTEMFCGDVSKADSLKERIVDITNCLKCESTLEGFKEVGLTVQALFLLFVASVFLGLTVTCLSLGAVSAALPLALVGVAAIASSLFHVYLSSIVGVECDKINKNYQELKKEAAVKNLLSMHVNPKAITVDNAKNLAEMLREREAAILAYKQLKDDYTKKSKQPLTTEFIDAFCGKADEITKIYEKIAALRNRINRTAEWQ